MMSSSKSNSRTAKNLARKRLSATMLLEGPRERVFPLLCPSREYDWIESWSCDLLWSESGLAELDCLFRTYFPDDGGIETWMVIAYEPPACIEFARLSPSRATRYRIELSPAGVSPAGASPERASPERASPRTRATWTQLLTALDPLGERLLADMTPERNAQEMALLERMLNHYLMTGTRLALGGASLHAGPAPAAERR